MDFSRRDLLTLSGLAWAGTVLGRRGSMRKPPSAAAR